MGRSKGASREHKGASREHRGSTVGALGRSKKGEVLAPRKPNLAALYSAIATPAIYVAVLPSAACCCLDSYSFAFHLVPMNRQGSLAGVPATPNAPAFKTKSD